MSTIKSSAENLTLNADGSGNDIKFQSNASEVAEITDGGVISSTGGSTHADDVKAKFGTGNDLEISHNGTDSLIDSNTGILKILSDDLRIFNAAGTESLAKMVNGGAAELYHNDSKKFETISGGCRIPSGGLLFGSDTAAANALDDYEEGTFTPVASNLSAATGSYTKIGNKVHCKAYVAASGATGIDFTGMPFTASGAAGYGAGGGIATYQNQNSTEAWQVHVNVIPVGYAMYLGSGSKQLQSGEVAYVSFTYTAA